MANASLATQSLISNLAAYFRSNVAGLSVLTEWPNANQKLKYPSLSIFSQPARFMNHMPSQLSKTAPDVNNQITVTEDVGEYDLKMQLDLWCSDKVMRDKYLGLVIDALNAQVADNTGNNNSMGLSLQLPDWYGEWARYDLDSHQYIDDEAAAQRQERRVKIDLLANVRAIRQRTYYAMVNIQGQLGVTTLDSQMTDDASNTTLINNWPAYSGP